MEHRIQVENIKCGGCAGTIRKKLNALDGVESTEVDIDNGIVIVEGASDLHDHLTTTLLGLGYPESGTAEGIKAAKAKAKSFVSCAVGRLNPD